MGRALVMNNVVWVMVLVVLALVEADTPPGIANNPSHARCLIKKYKMCYNLEHVCPKFCPDSCTVECVSCKPICSGGSTSPPEEANPPTSTSPPDHGSDGDGKSPPPSKGDEGKGAPPSDDDGGKSTPPSKGDGDKDDGKSPPPSKGDGGKGAPPSDDDGGKSKPPSKGDGDKDDGKSPPPSKGDGGKGAPPPSTSPSTPSLPPPTPATPTPYPPHPTPSPSPPTETPPPTLVPSTPRTPPPSTSPTTPSLPPPTPATPTPYPPHPTPSPSPPTETPPPTLVPSTPRTPPPSTSPTTPSLPPPTPATPTPYPPHPTPSPPPPTESPPPSTSPTTPSLPPPTPATPTPYPPHPTPSPSPPSETPPPTLVPSTPGTPPPSPPSAPSGSLPPPTPSPPSPGDSSEVAAGRRKRCKNRNYPQCYGVQHVCPSSCPGTCEVDCVTCKPVCKCDMPGAVCQDPRFIGGDGLTFYFHGKKDKSFCLVTDPNLQINAHFIGKTNPTMNRDFTWVQSIAVLFGHHRLLIAALKTATWNDRTDRLSLHFNNHPIPLPPSDQSTWHSSILPAVTITRDSDTNSVIIKIEGLLQISAKVVPITEHESRVHNYGITEDDCFAHLELGFKFVSLSGKVNGVLGQTYGDDYVSRVKMGVAMPVIGGEREFAVSDIFATDCSVSQFRAVPGNYDVSAVEIPAMECGGGIGGEGVVCKK